MRRKRGGPWRILTAPGLSISGARLIDLSVQRHPNANRLGAGPESLDRGNPDDPRCLAFVPASDVKV
jgi:hypothetical protein